MLKKTIASIVIGGALLGGAASAGIAYAGTPSPTPTISASRPTTVHPLHAWLRSHRRYIRRAGITISAKTIGVTRQDLVSEVRSGKSIAEVAGEHHVSSQAVVDAIVSAAEARVDRAVTENKLTPAQASRIKAALPGKVTKVVNRNF